MAQAIKFYKGTLPSTLTVGGVYFDKTSKTIKVATSTSAFEEYGAGSTATLAHAITHYRGRIDFRSKPIGQNAHLTIDGMATVSVKPPQNGEYLILLHNKSTTFSTVIFLWANGNNQGDFTLDPGEIYCTSIEVTDTREEIWFDAGPYEEQDEGEAYELGYIIVPYDTDNLPIFYMLDNQIPIVGGYTSLEEECKGAEAAGDFWVTNYPPGRVYALPGTGAITATTYTSVAAYLAANS